MFIKFKLPGSEKVHRVVSIASGLFSIGFSTYNFIKSVRNDRVTSNVDRLRTAENRYELVKDTFIKKIKEYSKNNFDYVNDNNQPFLDEFYLQHVDKYKKLWKNNPDIIYLFDRFVALAEEKKKNLLKNDIEK